MWELFLSCWFSYILPTFYSFTIPPITFYENLWAKEEVKVVPNPKYFICKWVYVCSRLKSTMRQQQKKASLVVFVNSRIFYLELIRKILNILLHTLQFTLCGSKKDISNVLMRKRREINLLSENYDYGKGFCVSCNRETWLGCSLAVLKEII